MPCDSITTQSIALKNAMPSIIETALKGTGWLITGTTTTMIVARKDGYILSWEKGAGVTVTGRTKNENTIRDLTREYSKQSVTWAASRAGWKVTDTGSNKLTVTRRQ